MKRIIYLDNAATTYPKPRSVLKQTSFCLRKYGGNASRSSHSLSLKTGEAIYSVREKLASLMHFDNPENIVFTYNATYALNIAIKSFLTEKCHIICSDFEHNSVIRPLEALKSQLGVSYSFIDSTKDLLSELKKNLLPDTKGIISSIASNVTGRRLQLKVLSDFARENRLFLIVDASQAVGHFDVDLSKTPCDALCAPGHKALFGIQGSGFVIFKDNKRRKSFIEGGSGSESLSTLMPIGLPEGYEAGTLGAPAIISIGAGIDYINSIGIDNIEERLTMLTEAAYERLSKIEKVKIYGRGNGIISFSLGDSSSSEICSLLDKSRICTRGGLHCAPSVHRLFGTTEKGLVRVSFSYLNSVADTDALYKALKKI